MASELRMLLLTSTACLLVVLTGVSQARVETTMHRAAPVTVGETAPDFALEDQNGKKVSLSDARGKSPVVLVFYRGYW